MWFESAASKTFNLAIMLLFFALVSSCTAAESNQPLITSFDTNGTIFAYSTPETGVLQKIYVVDKNGDTLKKLETKGLSIGEVHFGAKRFYYVEYDVERKNSKIFSCDLNFSDCSPIYEMSGSIRHPVELDGNTLLFIRSHVKPETHRDSGYAHFQFYKYDIESGKLSWIVGPSFYSTGPIYKIGNKILYSALIDRKFKITNDGNVQSRDDYYFDIRDKKVTQNRNTIALGGSFYLVSSVIINEYYVYYLGDSSKGNYIYKTCIRKEYERKNCSLSPTKTTIPAFVGDDVYYGIWDSVQTKLKITKVNLGEKTDG